MCVKCENFKLLLTSLRTKNVIMEKNPREVIESLCCDVDNEDCLFRLCQTCRSKEISYEVIDKDEKMMFRKWGKAQIENKKKPGVVMKITQKGELESSVGEAVESFQKQIPEYMAHIARVKHQHLSLKDLESNLTENDLMIAIDWSENWQCKYHAEVQSVHFGASHQQLSLHTGIVKSKDLSQTFCTVSDINDHGPKAIFAHTKPILLKFATERTDYLHFFRWAHNPI